jgi:hypothetical protein
MKIQILRKMKRINYKPGMLLLAAFLLSFALNAQEVTKDFHKEYKADKNTTLEISNRYGDVIIENWDKDQVVIDVRVTVDVDGKERAEKYLSMIDVQFTEGAGLITAKTIIDEDFKFSGWGRDRKFSIDYRVKMPYVTSLTLANRYGNTDIDELRGVANIDIKYGNLSINKLTRGNEKPINKIAISYGKGNVDEAVWLDIYARYCSPLEITKSQALLIDSRYSKFRIGSTSSIVSDSRYDTYSVDNMNNLVMEAGYTTTTIGTLTKKLSYEGSYASLNVETIPGGFESLDAEVRYTQVRLGISESANYRVEGKASYGGIKLNEDRFKYQKRIVENSSTEISGVVGSEESPTSKVNVSASYGSIKLY